MSVILVTGANGGLGLAIGRSFLEADPSHIVWIGVRSRRDRAEAMAGEWEGRCKLVTLDVTKDEDGTAAVVQITQESGSLDVLINNAGHHEDGLLATMTDHAWHEVIQSNLTGAFLGCRAVTRNMMSQRSGRIVNIASLSAIMAPQGQTNYAAAKAGMVALTQSFAKEVARAGITVNVVCPGYIDTEALSEMGPEQRKAATMRVPMRRLGKPSEVAAAVLFLASPQASYITGATLKIDGGIF